jgi:hypothetical protein
LLPFYYYYEYYYDYYNNLIAPSKPVFLFWEEIAFFPDFLNQKTTRRVL